MKAKTMHANKGFRSKVASGLKFFFTGNDECFNKAPSSAKELSSAELDMVTGSDAAAAEAYLQELCRKYGVNNKFDALEKATEEELIHHIELFYS